MTKKNDYFHRLKRDMKTNWLCYLMFVPTIVFFVVFCYMPIYGISIAFLDYRPALKIFQSRWVGLANFRTYFESVFFLRNLKNTLILTMCGIVFEFPVPIIFALLLNELRNIRFKKWVQNITYLPNFVSTVVICGILTILTSSQGAFNKIIALFSPDWQPTNLLSISALFRPLYVGSNIWQGFGWGSILYLSALSSIDMELYEAALMDGASRWKQTIHITIPGILPTICLMLILKCSSILSTGAEKIILLYSPSTYNVADVLDTFIYREGVSRSQYSESTAVGMAVQTVNLVMMLFVNTITKRLSGNGLW